MSKFLASATGKLALIILGIAVNAFAVAAFCLPYNILVGGATGLGRLIHHFTPIPVSVGVLIVNMILLLLAFVILGKKYAATIVLGSVLYPFLLDLFGRVPGIDHLVDDPLVAAICGGILMGAGIGLVIRSGGSLGGSDVLPLILKKKLGWSIAVTMYAFDVVVLVLQGFLATPNEIILGILMTLTYTVVTNQTLLAGGGQVQIFVFSPEVDVIKEELVDMGFGATLLHAESGYYEDEVDVLVTVVSARFLNNVKDKILTLDDKAFMTVSSVREVNGRGFTISLDA